MNDECDDTRQAHGQSHPLQVDERRIAQHSGISMEHTEPYDVKDHVHEDGLRQDNNISQCHRSSVIEPEHEQSREITDETVHDEHQPIRQGVL